VLVAPYSLGRIHQTDNPLSNFFSFTILLRETIKQLLFLQDLCHALKAKLEAARNAASAAPSAPVLKKPKKEKKGDNLVVLDCLS
jgi:hypothetical protein